MKKSPEDESAPNLSSHLDGTVPTLSTWPHLLPGVTRECRRDPGCCQEQTAEEGQVDKENSAQVGSFLMPTCNGDAVVQETAFRRKKNPKPQAWSFRIRHNVGLSSRHSQVRVPKPTPWGITSGRPILHLQGSYWIFRQHAPNEPIPQSSRTPLLCAEPKCQARGPARSKQGLGGGLAGRVGEASRSPQGRE